jgi:hypothetical protein
MNTKRILIFVVLMLAYFIVSLSLAAGVTEEATKLTLEKLNNSEYVVGGEKIKLTNGIYERGSSPSDYLRIKILEVAFGDLNKDGKEDAAIIVGSSGGGSGFFIELAAMVNRNGNPYHVASADLGDRVKIKYIAIESWEINIIEFCINNGKNYLNQGESEA